MASREFSDGELTNKNNQPDIQTNSTFYFSQISVEHVALRLRNLKATKSTGLDKIPAKILKFSSDIIAPSLAYIFNLSLETSIYVDDRKRARIISVYKSEDKRKCENYRPISMLPAVRKAFERECSIMCIVFSVKILCSPDFSLDLGLNIQHYPL